MRGGLTVDVEIPIWIAPRPALYRCYLPLAPRAIHPVATLAAAVKMLERTVESASPAFSMFEASPWTPSL